MTHGHVFAQAKHGKTPGSPRGDWKVRKPIIKTMNVYLPPSIIFPKQQGRYSAFILKPHFVFRYIFATIHLDFKTPVYSPRRGRFVNSAFPNKKNLAQKRSLFMTSKFESKCLQQFYVSSKHEKECYMKTTS